MSQEIKQQDFEIVSWNDGLDILTRNKIGFFDPSSVIVIDSAVNIFVFEISNIQTLIMPEYPVMFFSKNIFPCFVYTSKSRLESDIKNRSFPIPEEFITILEREKEELLHFDNNYNRYIEFVDKALNTNFSKKVTFEELSMSYPLLGRHASGKQFDKLILSFSIIINKFIVETEGGKFCNKYINQGYSQLAIPCACIEKSLICSYESLRSDDFKDTFQRFFAGVLLGAKPKLERFKNLSYSEYFKRLKDIGYY
jgi:hypothetical protein